MPDNKDVDNKDVDLEGGPIRDFSDRSLAFYEIPEQVSVHDWHPEPRGQGKPTQVHLVFGDVDGHDPVYVVRMKSAAFVDFLIDALVKGRESVFGKRG